jgi:hypothetical protein
MVDLPSIFWNQVREQLTVWHKEFSTSTIGQMLATTSLT